MKCTRTSKPSACRSRFHPLELLSKQLPRQRSQPSNHNTRSPIQYKIPKAWWSIVGEDAPENHQTPRLQCTQWLKEFQRRPRLRRARVCQPLICRQLRSAPGSRSPQSKGPRTKTTLSRLFERSSHEAIGDSRRHSICVDEQLTRGCWI